MKTAFTILLLVHALIHALGFVKAFGLAQLPQLTLPISRPLGVLWLGAGMAMLGAAVALHAWPRGFWVVGALAVVASQAVIVCAWRDARFGTAANALVLLGVVEAFLAIGPLSLRAELDREVTRGLARATPQDMVTEQDLAPLPSKGAAVSALRRRRRAPAGAELVGEVHGSDPQRTERGMDAAGPRAKHHDKAASSDRAGRRALPPLRAMRRIGLGAGSAPTRSSGAKAVNARALGDGAPRTPS